jgi:hypothetical protein
MAEFKFNVPAELLPLLDDSDFHFVGLVIPKIKVEHSKMGKHRFYTELMEGNEMKIVELGDVIEGVILHDEDFRILLNEAGEVICGAVAGVPYTEPPMAQLCIDCQYYRFGSGCKSKKRVYLMLGKEDPQVFSLILPPASLKHYRAYAKKLGSARIPMISALTRMELINVKGQFNYAEIVPTFSRYLTPDELRRAKEFKNEILTTIDFMRQRKQAVAQLPTPTQTPTQKIEVKQLPATTPQVDEVEEDFDDDLPF